LVMFIACLNPCFSYLVPFLYSIVAPIEVFLSFTSLLFFCLMFLSNVWSLSSLQ
jgi:hypothetical protein